MFNHILKAAFPKVNTPLFAFRVRQLNLTRLESDGILICFAGASIGTLFGFSTISFSSYNNFANTLIFCAFMLTPAGDFLYSFVGLAAARRLPNRLQWEDLRLTNLSAYDIVGSEFAALQMRLWRLMALECAVRLAFITSAISNMLVRADLTEIKSFTIAMFSLGAAYAVSYGMEPLWRMRALSACALLFGTWLRNPVIAGLLNTVFGIFLHAIAAGAMFGGFMALLYISSSVFWGYVADISAAQFLAISLLSVVLWAVIRGSHRLLTQRALKALAHRLEQIEPY